MPPIPQCIHCDTNGPDDARKWGLCRTCYANGSIRCMYRNGRPPQSREKYAAPTKLVSTSTKLAPTKLAPIKLVSTSTKLAPIKLAPTATTTTLAPTKPLIIPPKPPKIKKIDVAAEEKALEEMIAQQMQNLPDWWYGKGAEDDASDTIANLQEALVKTIRKG